ncbi:alpha/beta fold hydrolase [Streptomyces sp. NPDC088732]|uniref:alpha/beta fold hydrolase n=1 Tax=Streptomyces sp. NPDC088732 TaxID=3365879 RepID=UPI003801CDD7
MPPTGSALTDHRGEPLAHGRTSVNGVTLHHATGGTGEPVILLHGVPKTMFYWRRLVPLLTPQHTVVAVDIRGFGDSDRPVGGYDTRTMADDVAALASDFGFDTFRVVGEDWGANIAYATAAFHRARVTQLVFQETRLPGLPVAASDLPERPDDPRNNWHRAFFGLPHYPEFLLAGKERAFWTYFMKRTMGNPAAVSDADLEELIGWVTQPGATHAILALYRSTQLDAAQNQPHYDDPITCPVLAVGAQSYFGDEVGRQMSQVATDVRSVVIGGAGHNIALEQPARLAEAYLEFFGTR